MEKALKELKDNNLDLTNLCTNFIKSEKTYINDKTLYYKSINEGLFYLVHYKENINLSLTNNFNTFGVMLDASRGAVYKVSYLKNLIRKHALMGINELWLYIEDIYKLEKYPHFGYLRGSYSFDELKEVVDYANVFDIKVVPAIQTLGHMEQFLRWRKSAKVRDQYNVLLIDEKETYILIEEMLKEMKKIFKHDKIHVGLDETWGFGFGNYYKRNGYKPQIDLFFKHLNKVNELALKVGFKDVLIWSDMPYRIMSKTNYYYDVNISFDKKILKLIPDNINFVYWDYYNRNYDIVSNMLKNHQEMSKKIVFASGTWIWTRFTYDKKQTDLTCNVHIEASINNNVKEFILTQWMDDGAYGNHESTLLGVYEMSIRANTTNEVSSNVYEFITKDSLTTAYNRAKLNELTIPPVNLMWDDPQFSLMATNYVKNDLKNYDSHFKEMEELINLYKDKLEYEFEYNIVSANYYKLKGRYQMIKNYINKEEISSSKYFLKQITHLENLNNIYRNIWYNKNKMNGLEIIQSRLALQIIRAKEMIEIEKLYNKKEIVEIEGILDEVKVFDEVLSAKHSNIAYTTMPI